MSVTRLWLVNTMSSLPQFLAGQGFNEITILNEVMEAILNSITNLESASKK